ncbi:hypothetical protein McanMca71_002827 [Microsporum canis]
MSRITPEETNVFLIKCIKYSNNGKVDFAAVAEECGIVSKGAAAKRYERILKGNGIHPSSSEGGEDDASSGCSSLTPKKGGASKPKTPRKTPTKSKPAGVAKTPTKRKTKGASSESPTKKIKSEEKGLDSDVSDKADGDDMDGELPLRTDNDPFLPSPVMDKEAEQAMFEEFCNTGVEIKGEDGQIENQVV